MVEDIDALIRLDPMEQVHYEKEQNLYSIIKTVEYLVSPPAISKVLDRTLKSNFLSAYDLVFRNSRTHQAKSLEPITTTSSVLCSINSSSA